MKIKSLIGYRCMGCDYEIHHAPYPHCGAF